MSRTIAVDFDGTVTEIDLLDTIARDFGDPVVYQEVDEGLDAGTMPLREVITREFEPVRRPLEEVVQWELENVRVRDGFRDFVRFAGEQGWRVVIVSSGFHELIEPVLEREAIRVDLVANRLDPRPEGWRALFRPGPVCAVCGEQCKRSDIGRLDDVVYVGDGFSDRCIARGVGRVFARDGLAAYLTREGVAFESFEDFYDVEAGLGAAVVPPARSRGLNT